MSELDLLRCKTEDLAVGKLYVCPNTNLIRNNIRNSCLGSMFFGHTKKMMEKCHIFPSISEEEFAEQVSEDSVIYFSKVNTTQYRQSCQGKITILPNITGLTTVTVPAGCKLVSEKYTFILPTKKKKLKWRKLTMHLLWVTRHNPNRLQQNVGKSFSTC